MNDKEGAEAGFGYKITMTVSGGPEGGSPINYLTTDNSGPAPATGASKLDSRGTKVREQFGGAVAISYSFLGREPNGDDYTYLRDPSSNLRFTLELDNGQDLDDITYVLGDMDYSFENTDPSNPCYGPTDNNNYNCRFSYIDQVTVVSGVGTNEYTFSNPDNIFQVGDSNVRDNATGSSRRMEGDTFYARVPDSEDDKKVDLENDGKIPGDDASGNITVYNPGNIGKQIIFDYSDPGYGLASDPDGYHDFDSYNQVMSFLSGMTFGSCLSISDVQQDINLGEQACITVGGTTDFIISPMTGVSISGQNVCFSPQATTVYTVTSGDPSCTKTEQFTVRIWSESTVPTMSQWGLMIFGLLILNLAVFFVFQQEQIIAGVARK